MPSRRVPVDLNAGIEHLNLMAIPPATPPRPTLVFGYGNPSRGDDALGPLLIERLAQSQRAGGLPHLDLLTDFQPQIEHALDLQGRERVVFVDAAARGPAPFAFTPLLAEPEASYTTHSMHPGVLLRVFREVMGAEIPATWLLAIRGYSFDLGDPPSAAAVRNLEAAHSYLAGWLVGGRLQIRRGKLD